MYRNNTFVHYHDNISSHGDIKSPFFILISWGALPCEQTRSLKISGLKPQKNWSTPNLYCFGLDFSPPLVGSFVANTSGWMKIWDVLQRFKTKKTLFSPDVHLFPWAKHLPRKKKKLLKKKSKNQEADALWQHGWFHDLWPNASPTSMLMAHPTPSSVIIGKQNGRFKLHCHVGASLYLSDIIFISIHCLSSNGWLSICYQTFKYLKIRWCWESLSYFFDLFWGWRHLWHLVFNPQLLPPFEWFESHPFTTGPWLESGPDSKKDHDFPMDVIGIGNNSPPCHNSNSAAPGQQLQAWKR